MLRAAARALDASLALIDRSSAILAVAARSPAEERTLVGGGEEVQSHELRVADAVVGVLRMRPRGAPPSPTVLRLALTLIASEVERVRGPARASEAAAAAFVQAVLRQEIGDRRELLARGRELGMDLARGGSVIVVRAHPLAPISEDWRPRALMVAERGGRAVAPGTAAILLDRPQGHPGEVALLVPDADEAVGRRVAEAVQRELQAGLQGFAFAVGRSRVATDPLELQRAAHEALLAANVAEGHAERRVLAFEETGAYRLLLSAMSENPDELRRFYAETLEPLVAYDEQYETDLVKTLETFLDNDGSVAGTAQRLFTHRHTIRYRLERVRELSGLDVGSSDGRERLSLGLKAMRVLGIPPRRGPATEAGAEGGRVPGGPDRG